MRLRAALCGSRFGRGVVVPGGVRFDGRVDLDAMLEAIDDLREGAAARPQALPGHRFDDRPADRLRPSRPRRLIEDYGAVGPLARGSGVSIDARHERPYGDYRRLGLQVVTARDGDAMARVEVRFGEITESLRILRQAIDQLRRTRRGAARRSCRRRAAQAFGWAEAPQGELAIWVEVAEGTAPASADRLALAAQLGALRPCLPGRRAHRLRLHRALLRPDPGGS